MHPQPVELIIARNLIAAVELAAFIVDPEGTIVFFNDSAGELIGRRFDEVGPLTRDEWNSRFGPFDEFGKLIPTRDMPLSLALREGLPANGRFSLHKEDGETLEVEVSALPLVTALGFEGAIVVFWQPNGDGDGGE